MADEIETTAQLIELAVLRDVVIHELVATRGTARDAHDVDLQPEELHAPGSPNDEVAMSFCTRLEEHQLGVRCRVETYNAYGRFVVDGEAIFDMPAPVSSHQLHIVDEFTEQVGALAVFPYIRAAVASLAAVMSVPASPLPIFRAGDLTVTLDDEPVVEDEPSEPFMHGIAYRTTDDGGQEEIAEFFHDRQTGRIVRIGGEGQSPDVDELLDAWAKVPPPEEFSSEDIVRQHGEASLRQSIEDLREANGDAATDLALAEIDEAAAHIQAEDAFLALNTAVERLDLAIAAARNTDTDARTVGDAGWSDISTALLDAAERVRDGWERVRDVMSS